MIDLLFQVGNFDGLPILIATNKEQSRLDD